MKKKLLSVAVIAICVAVLGYSTLAYFNDETVAHNVIASGGVSVQINETTDQIDPETGEAIPFEDVSGVMPGMSVSKIVELENNGPSDEWVRVAVSLSIRNRSPLGDLLPGDELPLTIVVGEEEVDVLALDYNDEDWTWDEETGYWYYNQALASGEETEPLFTKVSFAPQMGNEYQNSHVEINICAYAVQTANNGETALEAAGWPAE